MSSTITFPGLIDCHVHFREPGNPEKADMDTESAAAFAGGVHTVCDMPNTNPPPQTVEVFADKVERAKRITNVDIRFFFGVQTQDHLVELRDLWINPDHAHLKAKCSGLKLFLEHSTGNMKVEPEVIEAAFQLCGELDIPLVAHCEDPEMNEAAAAKFNDGTIHAHSKMRPPESEGKAVAYAIDLVRKYSTPFHVAHMSTSFAAEHVRNAKKEGLSVTCEAAPHHLFLTTEDYDHLGTLGKMNPPLRDPEHQQALWEAIADGTVDCVGTDHAPHTLEQKQCEQPLEAPSGVPGVETMISLLLSVAHGDFPHPQGNGKLKIENGKFTYEDIRRLCFENPNRIFRLGVSDRDAITIDPEEEWIIHGSELHSKCGWTPYEGWTVVGRVRK